MFIIYLIQIFDSSETQLPEQIAEYFSTLIQKTLPSPPPPRIGPQGSLLLNSAANRHKTFRKPISWLLSCAVLLVFLFCFCLDSFSRLDFLTHWFGTSPTATF